MKAIAIAMLVVLVLTAMVAMDATGAEAVDEAGAEQAKKSPQAILGMTLVPALLLLVTLPIAVIFSASVRLPSRVADTLSARPAASVLLGAANLVILVLLGSVAEGNPAVGGISAIVFLILMVVALIGLCGVATRLGRRLFRDETRGDGMGAFTLAWLVISGVPLLPVIGLLYVIWLMAGGIGGTLLTVYAGRK